MNGGTVSACYDFPIAWRPLEAALHRATNPARANNWCVPFGSCPCGAIAGTARLCDLFGPPSPAPGTELLLFMPWNGRLSVAATPRRTPRALVH